MRLAGGPSPLAGARPDFEYAQPLKTSGSLVA